MHAMHDTYDPMHPPKVPAEARHGRSVPQKLLDPSARRSADVRSMHELEHQRRARSTSNVEQPHARVRERDMHEEHDCVHVVHASQDAGSDSDDSYAWAHQKAEMQRKGVWRGTQPASPAHHACGTCIVYHKLSQVVTSKLLLSAVLCSFTTGRVHSHPCHTMSEAPARNNKRPKSRGRHAAAVANARALTASECVRVSAACGEQVVSSPKVPSAIQYLFYM